MSAVYSPHVEFLRKWGARAAATGSSSIQRESRWHQTVASTLQIQATTKSRSSQWGSAAAAIDEDDVKVCSLNLMANGVACQYMLFQQDNAKQAAAKTHYDL